LKIFRKSTTSQRTTTTPARAEEVNTDDGISGSATRFDKN
jgi:hypothetical protein